MPQLPSPPPSRGAARFRKAAKRTVLFARLKLATTESSRASDALESGPTSDFLMREYRTFTNVDTVIPVEFFQWFKERLVKLHHVSLTRAEDPAPPNVTYQVMCRTRLVLVLSRDMSEVWASQGATTTPAGTSTKTLAGAGDATAEWRSFTIARYLATGDANAYLHSLLEKTSSGRDVAGRPNVDPSCSPVQRFRHLALLVLMDRRKCKEVRRCIERITRKPKSLESEPHFLLRDGPDSLSERNRAFWTLYHRDEVGRENPPSESKKSRQDRKAASMSPTWGQLSGLMAGSQTPVSTPSSSPAHYKRQPGSGKRLSISRHASFTPNSFGDTTASMSWESERHAREMRSTQLRKISQQHRDRCKLLAGIGTSMQTASAARDVDFAQKEMARSKSETLFAPVSQTGWQTEERKEKLPPVLGFSNSFRAFRQPSMYQKGGLEKQTAVSASRYIRACQEDGTVPTHRALRMAQTRSISTQAGEMVTNEDLLSLAALIPKMDALFDVDLSGATRIDDSSLVLFLDHLYGRPANISLTSLSLSGCTAAGRGTLEAICTLLNDEDGVPGLRHLDLSGITFPGSVCVQFSETVRDMSYLKSLMLANTGLGLHTTTETYLGNFLQAEALSSIDLSWNSFSEENFRFLGRAVADHGSLQTLSLAHCTGSRLAAGGSHIDFFVEHLSQDSNLTSLDIGANLIDFQAALVLEDALEANTALKHLRVSNNPLGEQGMRSVLRTRSRGTSAVVDVECEDCFAASMTQSVVFCFTYPCRYYELDLRNPHQRATLRMLYKFCERVGVAPSEAFSGVKCYQNEELTVPTSFSHADKDAHGVFNVPSSCIFTATFKLDDCLMKRYATAKLSEPHDEKAKFTNGAPAPHATRLISRFFEQARLTPCPTKIGGLLAHFQGSDIQMQSFLVSALTHDFNLDFGTMAALQQILKDKERGKVLGRLIQTMPVDEITRYSFFRGLPRLDDFLAMHRFCDTFLMFNPENPTGHYFLRLENPSHYSMLHRLLLIDRWEALMAKDAGRRDMSEHGNWSNFRNCKYGNERITDMHLRHLPYFDTLEFDFASWRRPPLKAEPLSDEGWNNMMHHIANSPSKDTERVAALHQVSHQAYFLAIQVRELLGYFKTSMRRVELLASLFFRLSDCDNAKLLLARILGTPEWEELRSRLGTLAVFPFIQPEGHHVKLDLSLPEHRIAANSCVVLALKENLGNVRNPSLVYEEDPPYQFTMGVPVSWQTLAEIPSNGILEFDYVCAPEERCFGARREFARSLAGWNSDTPSENILWWCALQDMKEPFPEFMNYMVRTFKDPYDCFKKLKSSDTMSRTDISAGVQKYGWKSFETDPEKVKDLFRLLNPDQSGSVTEKQWALVEYHWLENQLCVIEFLRHLDRSYRGDLQEAFAQMDADKSGEVDREEWEQMAQMSGFYGPSSLAFNIACTAFDNGQKDVIRGEGWRKLIDLWEHREVFLAGLRMSHAARRALQESASAPASAAPSPVAAASGAPALP